MKTTPEQMVDTFFCDSCEEEFCSPPANINDENNPADEVQFCYDCYFKHNSNACGVEEAIERMQKAEETMRVQKETRLLTTQGGSVG